MYLNYEAIKRVHLEITSRCNAACPQCQRTGKEGGVNPELPMGELSLSDIENIFVPELCARLEHIWICGNFGDAMVSDTTIPAIEYFHRQGVKQVTLHTNGSGRTRAWWRELAAVMKGPKDRVTFGIDGLEDTNHLYRRNTNWNKIMQSAEAFISAGGRAVWDFLVFEHNEHQVEDARALAEQMGFSRFRPKASFRFAASDVNSRTNRELVRVCNRKGELVGSLKQPVNERYRNPDLQKVTRIIEERGLEQYYETTEIQCRTQADESIFVSFEGELWPCCWTANRKYDQGDTPYKRQVRNLYRRYGPDFNCLRKHSMRDIINSSWFREHLVQSWSCDAGPDRPERLFICGRQCGREFNPRVSQYL